MKCKTCSNEAAVYESEWTGYCGECVKTGKVPLHFLVAITAAAGSLDDCSGWWRHRVLLGIRSMGVTRKEFDEEVAERVSGVEVIDVTRSAEEAIDDADSEKKDELHYRIGKAFSLGIVAGLFLACLIHFVATRVL